jgi:hypothetical protein
VEEKDGGEEGLSSVRFVALFHSEISRADDPILAQKFTHVWHCHQNGTVNFCFKVVDGDVRD